MKQGIKLEYYFPIIGGLYYFWKSLRELNDPAGFLKQVVQKDNEKPLILTHMGFGLYISILNRDLIQDFLFKRLDQYKKSSDFSPTFYNFLQNGLLFSENEKWKKQRRIISKAFHYEFLREMVPSIMEISVYHFEQIKDKQINVMDEMQKITGDVICRMFFGSDFSKRTLDGQPISLVLASTINDMMEQMQTVRNLLFGKFLIKYPITKLDKRINQRTKYFKDIALETIQQRKNENQQEKNKRRRDLLDILLEQQREDVIQGNSQIVTEEEIVDNFLTFFFAGMDTTGHLINNVLWFLSRDQEKLENVQNEIHEKIKNVNQVQIEEISQLRYLEACIKEALRIMTPASTLIYRVATEDNQLGNYIIKKGTAVTIQISALGFGRGLPNENTFVPERWISDTHDIEAIDTMYKIPFSAGARNCIGQHLAMIEAKLIIVLFLSQFSYTRLSSDKLEFTQTTLLELKDPFRAKLTKKNIIQ